MVLKLARLGLADLRRRVDVADHLSDLRNLGVVLVDPHLQLGVGHRILVLEGAI